MGFTKPLCILLGHYGSAIMGCASPYDIGLHGFKGQYDIGLHGFKGQYDIGLHGFKGQASQLIIQCYMQDLCINNVHKKQSLIV